MIHSIHDTLLPDSSPESSQVSTLSLSQSLSLSKFPLITLLLITNSIATPPANAPEEHSHHSHQIVIRSRQPHLYCTVLFCNLYSSPTGVDSVCLSVCCCVARPPNFPTSSTSSDTTDRHYTANFVCACLPSHRSSSTTDKLCLLFLFTN